MAACSFTMDEALVKRIPSRMPYFFMMVCLAFILHGALRLGFLYEQKFRQAIGLLLNRKKETLENTNGGTA